MKKTKKFFIIVLSILTVVFTSCKSNEKPTPTFKVSSIVGTWTCAADTTYKFTVNDNGEITANLQIQIPNPMGSGSSIPLSVTLTNDSWDADKDKEVEQYEKTLSGKNKVKVIFQDVEVDITAYFTFKSANSCLMTATASAMKQTETIGPLPFTK